MGPRRGGSPPAARLTAAVVLLALGSGAVDALAFLGLGAVFAGVMTGNLVLLGVSAVRGDAGGALSAAAAITFYTAGVYAAASWLRRAPVRPRLAVSRHPAHGPRRPVRTAGHARAGPSRPRHRRVRRAFAAIALAQAAVLAGWLASAGRPGQGAQLGLLALSAFAMGVQSAGVNALPLAGAATTYLTGTLTALTTELATSGEPATMRRRFAVLAAAFAGAGLDAALLTWARPAAPAVPLAATISVLVVLGRGRRRPPPARETRGTAAV